MKLSTIKGGNLEAEKVEEQIDWWIRAIEKKKKGGSKE